MERWAYSRAQTDPTPRQVWAIRFLLDQGRYLRDRALFDFAIDSKLRGCDVVKVRIGDLVSGGQVRSRAIVVQRCVRKAGFESWRSGVSCERGTLRMRIFCP